jgi:hypothetical protein
VKEVLFALAPLDQPLRAGEALEALAAPFAFPRDVPGLVPPAEPKTGADPLPDVPGEAKVPADRSEALASKTLLSPIAALILAAVGALLILPLIGRVVLSIAFAP